MKNRQTTIGIVAGCFAPFHIGHMSLIEKACQENKYGVVYCSNKSRGSLEPGSLKKVWNEHIKSILPSNCHVFHLDHSPIKQIYDYLGTAEEERGGEKYRIYTESKDSKKNFSSEALVKYYPWLLSNGLLEIVEVPRDSNYSISGTDMRKFIKMGDKDSFFSFLPECDKEKVWNILSKKS